MAPKNAILWTTHPEYIELINFLIERTKEVKAPQSISQLARDFKEKSKSPLSERGLECRILKFRLIIHEMDDIDTDTKVKLLFALRVPINNYFLEYLQTRAEVILDNNNRIIKYRKYGGGLELESGETQKKPPKKRSNWESDPVCVDLFNFLIEKTNDAVSPLCLKQLAIEFKKKSGAAQTEDCLVAKIRSWRLRIHGMIHIDMDAKIKLLFALSVPISNYFLEYLRNRAEVILDDHQRIIKYRKYGGGLELEAIHPIIYIKSETIKRNETMMEFLAQKAMNENSPITGFSFARDFKKAMGAAERISVLAKRYNLLKKKIHKSTNFDKKTKIRMMFVSGASVPNYFLEILRKDALVEVDEKNKITKYRANDGSLELQGDQSRSAKNRAGTIESKRCYPKQITDYYKNREAKNEMGNLIEFITEKCKNVVDSPLSAWQLAKEFNSSFQASKALQTSYDRVSPDSLLTPISGIYTELARSYNRIRGYCREIQKLSVLDTPTKIRQLFGLGGPLNEDFLKELRKEAVVEVDHENRIVKYYAKDGSLTLKGNHRSSKKAEKDMGVATADGPNEESDEEELDDDSVEYLKIEVDSEFEPDNENDIDETEESTEPATEPTNHGRCSENSRNSEIVTTRSGRISKKRNLDVSPSPQKMSSSRKRAPISKKFAHSSIRLDHSETDRLEESYVDSDNLQAPEVKLEPFRGSIIDGFAPIDPEDDIKMIATSELCEPKKEVEEESIKTEMMEFPIKTEEDFIIPKEEELEEEDIKPELFY